MNKKRILKLLFSTLMICTLVLSGFCPIKAKANESNEYGLERGRPTEQVTYTHRENIASSGNQAFTVRITCTKTYLSAFDYVLSYTTGNYGLSSVVGGTATLHGDSVQHYATPDGLYQADVVEIDVRYTPTNTGVQKRYIVKFYIVNNNLYDTACEALK